MSRRKNKQRKSKAPRTVKKKKGYKKDTTRAHMPVQKPDDSHMPNCVVVGCKRKVSDARKTRCAHCGATTNVYHDYHQYGAYD